jgi:hypothetical protein
MRGVLINNCLLILADPHPMGVFHIENNHSRALDGAGFPTPTALHSAYAVQVVSGFRHLAGE